MISFVLTEEIIFSHVVLWYVESFLMNISCFIECVTQL